MRNKFEFVTFCIMLGIAGRYAVAADPPPRFANEQITLAEWQTYRNEVTSVPDVRCDDTHQHQILCVSESLKSVWAFTEPGHPAHPAVSTGVLVVYPHASVILFRGYYAGNEAAYYKWAPDAYKALPILDKWTQEPFAHHP
jgi:hypothetical protein